MNLKFLSTVISLLTILIAEILSHINLVIWDIISNSPSYSERYYYKNKLTLLFKTIEKLRAGFYFFFIITLIATIIICLVFPQVDGYIISPKVYGKTNNVNPLITIMAVSVGGTVAGFIGIVLALPCYLLIRTTYHFFQNDLKKGMDIVKETM